MFTALCPLVLASASPRRQQFLRDLGLDFRIVLPDGEEPRPNPGESPASYVVRTAQAKAAGTAPSCPGSAVVAADTIVVLGEAIFGKPGDVAESVTMLERLSGRQHVVMTAVSVILPNGQQEALRCESRVRFRAWPRSFLEAYARSGEPLDKAGGYAVQGLGSFLVDSIEGSWTNVVGLPLSELVDVLIRCRVLALRNA